MSALVSDKTRKMRVGRLMDDSYVSRDLYKSRNGEGGGGATHGEIGADGVRRKVGGGAGAGSGGGGGSGKLESASRANVASLEYMLQQAKAEAGELEGTGGRAGMSGGQSLFGGGRNRRGPAAGGAGAGGSGGGGFAGEWRGGRPWRGKGRFAEAAGSFGAGDVFDGLWEQGEELYTQRIPPSRCVWMPAAESLSESLLLILQYIQGCRSGGAGRCAGRRRRGLLRSASTAANMLYFQNPLLLIPYVIRCCSRFSTGTTAISATESPPRGAGSGARARCRSQGGGWTAWRWGRSCAVCCHVPLYNGYVTAV